MKKIITLLALFGSSLVMAQSHVAVVELQKILSPIKSMQANFKQTVVNENNIILRPFNGSNET